MLTRNRLVTGALAGITVALCALPALADDTIKVGLILELSGPFASQARQIANGAKAHVSSPLTHPAGRARTRTRAR